MGNPPLSDICYIYALFGYKNSQVDFNLPERFDVTYIGEDGLAHRPVMLHRVILGSIDRFIGILIEHFAGAVPFWLAPVQVLALTIADRHNTFAKEINREIREL